MEMLTAMVDIVGKVIMAIGMYFVVIGGYTFFDGYKSENSADLAKGGKILAGGGGILLLGSQIVPMLSGIFG